MSSTTQVEDEMMLLSSFLGCEISNQDYNPEHGEVENTPDPKPKRRRRRAKREGDLEAKKRKLNEEQVSFLEMNFVKEKKLECGRKVHLATEAGLDPKQVAVWFQNRRARWKSKLLEEEYLKLKSAHQAAIVDKCRLQAEVMKLKEQVSQAEADITVLSGGTGNVLYSGGGGRGGVLEPTSSPSTSVSVHTNHIQPLARDEFGYIDGYNYANILDWVDYISPEAFVDY